MGINFNLADGRKFNWDLDILKTAQGRATVGEVLPQLIKAARSDPKHPYNDTRHPSHSDAVREVDAVYRWLNNEMTPQEEGDMAKGLLSSFEKSALPEAPAAMTELSQLYASSEYKRASLLAKTNSAKLNDPDHRAEKSAWNRAAELEAAVKASEPKRQDVAYDGSPKSPGGLMKDTSRYVASSILELSKLPPGEQANRAREMAAAMRNDPAHPFNNGNHPLHAQAVREMSDLYSAQYYSDDGSPVIKDE